MAALGEATGLALTSAIQKWKVGGDLGEYFKKYGKVLNIIIVREYQTQISKRFGYNY